MFSRLSLASIFDNMRARSSQKERDRIEHLASNSSRNKTNKKKTGAGCFRRVQLTAVVHVLKYI